MLSLFIGYFVVLFVVVDPVGLAAMFAGLAQGETPARRRLIARRGTLIAGVVLVVFTLIGDALLRALGIGVAAFEIAGGALLFLLAVEMVFARHSGLRSTTPAEAQEAGRRRDIAVFPLAVPLIAGPGALTTVLLSVGEQGGDPVVVGIVLLAVFLVLCLTLAALYFSSWIMSFLGATGANVISRLLGILLAALAVQFVLNGWGAVTTPLEYAEQALAVI